MCKYTESSSAPQTRAGADPRPVSKRGPAAHRQAGEVAEQLFAQLTLAADAEHDLHLRVLEPALGQEVEEVVGLPEVAERVQRSEREGGVADPRVSVVQDPVSIEGLGQ